MTEIQAIILGSIIGGSIGVIGTYFGFRLTKSMNIETIKITDFNRAAAKIRAAFAPAQTKLYLSKKAGETNLREFFDNELPLHGAAIEEFRPFASDSVAYQKAWEEYRKTICDNDALGDAELRWWSGMVAGEGNEEIKNFLDVISKKIEGILHFSKPHE